MVLGLPSLGHCMLRVSTGAVRPEQLFSWVRDLVCYLRGVRLVPCEAEHACAWALPNGWRSG